MTQQNTIKNIVVNKEGFFPSEGRWLFYRSWHTTNKKGEILCVHGLTEHSERYSRFAEYLAQKGYDFHIFDITGHGRSEGRRGHIYHYEEYLVDIVNFYGFLRIHRKMGKPFLLGHSMGGLLATLFAAWGTCPIQGLILSAPLFQLKTPLTFIEKKIIGILSRLYSSFYVPSKIEPGLLTHDRNITEEYTVDPLVQRQITVSCVKQLIKAMAQVNYVAPYLNMPCLLWHGENDEITGIEGTKSFYQYLGSKNKELYIVAKGYHELFNEIGCQAIYAKTLEWLNNHK